MDQHTPRDPEPAPAPADHATDRPPPSADDAPHGDPAPASTPGMRVLLMADPGLPSRRARSVQDGLRRRLEECRGSPVTVETLTATVRLRDADALDLEQVERAAGESGAPDVVLLLTEIPRLHESRPLIAQVEPERGMAIVSLPTLGAAVGGTRLTTVLASCALRADPEGEDADPADPRGGEWTDAEPGTGRRLLRASRVLGSLRTVLGMVAGNEPLSTVPRLSSALAAASATGAFGIFYSSIWAMSTFLPTPRLLGIGLLAILVMTAWLILSNGLWDEPEHQGLTRVVLLYNLSTIITLLLCVVALYLVLALLIVIGGAIVIAPGYMEQEIGKPPTVGTYLDIAWLSAAMGVVAGALGSSFDTETDLRRLTHGQRERQRRYAEEAEA